MEDDKKNLSQLIDEFQPFLDSWWPYVIGLIFGFFTAVRSYMAGPVCTNSEKIEGKTVIITGASSGLGKETALELAKRGGHIILAVRNVEAGKKIAQKILETSGKEAEVREIDLSCLKSIRNFVEQLEIDNVDILINNAGIAFHPNEKTEEGLEIHFVTNYLGHFLLTQLLLPKLKASKQGRIINISAQAYSISSIDLENLNLDDNFSAGNAFGQSKLALIMMARHMSYLLKDTNVTINAVNPGLVRGTKHLKTSPLSSLFFIKLIIQPWMWLMMKTPKQGIQTIIYASVSSDLNNQSGKYLSDCEITDLSANALNDDKAEKLYMKSMMLVQRFLKTQPNESEIKN